jgi:hypothetical protein
MQKGTPTGEPKLSVERTLHVLALDVAGFAEAFAERNQIFLILGRPGAHEPHHRHRWLLRQRHQATPPRCRAPR